MKKLLAALLAILMLGTSVVVAETIGSSSAIDLSTLSYDELVSLKDQINLAMWNSGDWQEVTVPQGIYEVGKDIPAGHWTIKAVNNTGYGSAYIKCGDTLDASKKDLDWSDTYASDDVTSDKTKGFNANTDKTETDFELTDGMFVIVEGSNVIFTPYTGKPSLGFK